MPRVVDPNDPTGEAARSLVSRVGPLEIDWPRSIGYFGGVALAVAYDLIAPPLGLFIAAIPLVKLFKAPGRAWPIRIVADALDGAAKPVGGDSEGSVRWARAHDQAADGQHRGGRSKRSARRR
jgi:hypothetical protein